MRKSWQVSFLDNCIWIGYAKLSLWLRNNFSSGVNVSKISLKISHVTNRHIFNLNFPQIDEEYDKTAFMQG